MTTPAVQPRMHLPGVVCEFCPRLIPERCDRCGQESRFTHLESVWVGGQGYTTVATCHFVAGCEQRRMEAGQ